MTELADMTVKMAEAF